MEERYPIQITEQQPQNNVDTIQHEQIVSYAYNLQMSREAIPIKLVIVGDGTVGKTCLLVSYTQNRFPTQYVPTIFDNSTTTLKIDGKIINLGLWDTAGQQQYARLRPLAYPHTDIFFIAFAVTEKSTLVNAIKKWHQQIKTSVPAALCVFVGNKIDLRGGSFGNAMTQAEIRQQISVTKCAYFECSALTRQGLKELFQQSVKMALANKGLVDKQSSAEKDASDCNCQLI